MPLISNISKMGCRQSSSGTGQCENRVDNQFRQALNFPGVIFAKIGEFYPKDISVDELNDRYESGKHNYTERKKIRQLYYFIA
jgi:hypothetical protein